MSVIVCLLKSLRHYAQTHCFVSRNVPSRRPYRSFAIGHPDGFHFGSGRQEMASFVGGVKPVAGLSVVDPGAFQVSGTGGFDFCRQVRGGKAPNRIQIEMASDRPDQIIVLAG